jgi:exonuclease SbcC
MIPIRLRLRGFMSYREEQAIDFSGIHLACVAGDNGHGKSALLDAMTWAMWGKSRAGRDDDLITLGESEMWVDLEFGLGAQRYRVWRQRSRRGRGQTDLHLYIWNPGASDWQILDDGALRERQAQITRTLHMDYDTFVNSALLLQGKADSFTLKTPGERKGILADILGLARYEAYEARARDLATQAKEQAIATKAEINALDADLAQQPVLEAQLSDAQRAAVDAAATLARVEGEATAARAAADTLRSQAEQLKEVDARLARRDQSLQALRQRLVTAEARLRTLEQALAERDEIEQGYAAFASARDADRQWNERLLTHTARQEALAQAQRRVDQERARLEAELRRLQDRGAELATRAAQGPAQEQILAEARAALGVMEEQQARRDAIAAELRLGAEAAARLAAEIKRIKADGLAVKDKLEMLEDAAGAACPLCRQPLTGEQRDQMMVELQEEREALAGRYRDDSAALAEIEGARTKLEAEDETLARALRARDARQRQAATAEAAARQAQEAGAERVLVATEADAAASLLDAGDYAAEARAGLAALAEEIRTIGYDAARHTRVRNSLAALASYEDRYNRILLPALEGAGAAREQVAALAEQAAAGEAELDTDRETRARLAVAVAELDAKEAAFRSAVAAAEQAMAQERRAGQVFGAAQQRLDALRQQALRREARRADLNRINDDLSLYNELREAFGKNGLQAMIIESAIPEVEVEANRLLGRMTEGRMSVRLETQREKVTGGVAETLDIILSDELGPRPYELFSGGEAFRANLALRIAISRLLARRAGAQLQTLFIDEGFGSQDAQGLALVVEAINSIQSDFERILVITHVEELKDLFPARIDVTKTANGSRVQVA